MLRVAVNKGMVKQKLTVSIDPDLMTWIEEEIKKGYFADKSHAVQYSLLKVKELIKQGIIKF